MAFVLLFVFLFVALHAYDVSNSEPSPITSQFSAGGRIATSENSSVLIDKEFALFTTHGCFCAGNPVQIHITFYNSSFKTAFDKSFVSAFNKTYDSFIFTHSEGSPPINLTGTPGAYEVGRLRFFLSQTGKDCPIGAVCANGTLEWQKAGSTWGYFLVHNATGGHNDWVKDSDVEKGEPQLTIADVTGIAQLRANIRAEGLDWYILAFSVLALESVIDIASVRLRESIRGTKIEHILLMTGRHIRHPREWRSEQKKQTKG